MGNKFDKVSIHNQHKLEQKFDYLLNVRNK